MPITDLKSRRGFKLSQIPSKSYDLKLKFIDIYVILEYLVLSFNRNIFIFV